MTDMIPPTPSPGIVPEPPEPPVAMAGAQQAPQIKREPGDVPTPRANLVKELLKWVKDTKEYRKQRYQKMRDDMSFARPGNQWKATANTAADDRPYEANLVQRHIQQRVSALYAKNPKVVAKRRKRLDFQIWDGTQESLNDALSRVAPQPPIPPQPNPDLIGAEAKVVSSIVTATKSAANPAALQAEQGFVRSDNGQPAGPMLPPPPPDPTPNDIALLQDIAAGMRRRAIIDKVGDTLEILFHYFTNEGSPTFKVQAKQLVRRTITTGVGWVQLGFQRITGLSAETERRIADDRERLVRLQTLMADARDDKITEYQADFEKLTEGLKKLQEEPQVVLREGLVFDFVRSTDIIVDRDCTQLRGFLGAKRVAREYHYTKEKIKDIFKVDVGTNFTRYEPKNTQGEPIDDRKATDVVEAAVYAIWDKTTGQCYYVCEGYPDFLADPAGPEVKLDRFFPVFALTFNDLEDPNDVYPPSDVEILRPMQLEYNRSREGLREHRIASKPGWVSAAGVLSQEDKDSLANHSPNELLELSIPPDAVKEIDKYIAARPQNPLNPVVYEVEHLFSDIQRVSNEQDANFGGTSGASATESSIAETSRVSALQSNIDDLDDFLTELAREAGQVLLMEMSKEQVTMIVGPGAVWPEMSREQLAQEIFLEVEAASTGRPNKALEISNWQQMLPFLLQMPGISHDWLARQSIKRLDDSLDLTDAFASGVPSIVAQNAQAQAMARAPVPQPSTGNAATDPNQQGNVKFQPGDIGVPPLPGPKPAYPTLPNERPPGAR